MNHDLVSALRNKFKEKCSDLVPNEFDSRDVERFLNGDDRWVKTFFPKDNNIDKALESAEISLRWRKQYGVNDIRPEEFDPKLKTMLFWHGKDLKGRRVLHLNVGNYHKNDPCFKGNPNNWNRHTVYQLDTNQREQPEGPDHPIVIVMDMHTAGIANIDYDAMKFIIAALEKYFPNYTTLVIGFEMPWLLNAAWKIMQLWMSEESRRSVVFVGKKDIGKYIGPDSLLEHMRLNS